MSATSDKYTIKATTVIAAPQTGPIHPDPEYDFVAEPPAQKRGRQCGKCGMKFDYGVSYGYCCATINCPMGLGWGY